MAQVIMIQGTMSNVGKSLITAGLCRIFRQDGYRTAPFKSQNMALNSFITEEGLEMGRAQVMQAEAAGIKPSVLMNPILLKPTSASGSQVIVNGEVLGNMTAKDYFTYKKKLIPDILRAFRKLSDSYDIIVVEGAGSPAEINLKEQDIVNMGLAEMIGAPVLLTGDIDRGGVFAQLLGTLMLLTEKERTYVKGLLVNKFRGDKKILEPGISMLEEMGQVPVAGVIPYMELCLPDEDSQTERFHNRKEALIDIAVIRYPRISNFTDFDVFDSMEQVSLRYVTTAAELRSPDIVILPGSKNTIEDLKWMRTNGLEAAVKKYAEDHPVFGICGGYQMLGMEICDPLGTEASGRIRGMEILPVRTDLEKEKKRSRVTGRFSELKGFFAPLSGMELEGYEIHMGRTETIENKQQAAFLHISPQFSEQKEIYPDGYVRNMAAGTYVHGIFDHGEIKERLVTALAKRKGISWQAVQPVDYREFKESQYDKLADHLRQSMDMEFIYHCLQEAKIDTV